MDAAAKVPSTNKTIAGKFCALIVKLECRYAIKTIEGIRRTLGTTNIADTVAASSNLENHLPTREPLNAKTIGMGIAYTHLIC